MYDQLYQDFTTKMLPMVKEGLQITKDYFMDLFGRYIKYIIITDLIWIGIATLFLIIGITFLIMGIYKSKKDDWNGGSVPSVIFGTIFTVSGLLIGATQAFDLAEAYNVPEIRIYKELKLLQNRQ